jgi:4-hydroxy-3-polyprenylbenzoate decarboxylase
VAGPSDDLDHAALRHRYGGKFRTDATEKRAPLDRVEQPWPEEIRRTEEVRERVARRWREYGLG